MRAGQIFETVTVQGDRVSVAIEPIRHGLGLVVRNSSGGAVVMAMPAAHVSRAILSEMFDGVDSECIMVRLSE